MQVKEPPHARPPLTQHRTPTDLDELPATYSAVHERIDQLSCRHAPVHVVQEKQSPYFPSLNWMLLALHFIDGVFVNCTERIVLGSADPRDSNYPRPSPSAEGGRWAGRSRGACQRLGTHGCPWAAPDRQCLTDKSRHQVGDVARGLPLGSLQDCLVCRRASRRRIR